MSRSTTAAASVILLLSGCLARAQESTPAPSPQPAAPEAQASPSPTPAPSPQPTAPEAQASPSPAPAPSPPPGPGAQALAAGLEALLQGNLAIAEERFTEALSLDPGLEVARGRLAYIRFKRGNYKAAAADAQEAVGLDPQDSLAFLILGRSREALGDMPGAVAAYGSAAELSGGAKTLERLVASALGYYMRGLAREQGSDAAGAAADFKEASRIYPKNAYARYELGLALIKAGRSSEAITPLSEAIDLAVTWQPFESWLYPGRRYFFFENNIRYWRGVALRDAGRLDEATSEMEPLLAKVEGFAGAKLAGTNPASPLEGRVETSFLNVHYDDALAWQSKGDKARAASLLRTLVKLNLAEPAVVQKGKDLLKQMK